MMPNRILRDWTDSEKIAKLSAEAERFFVRLIMKADDFGRFHSNPQILKSLLFPLSDKITATQCKRWLNECASANLIVTYSADGKSCCEIRNYNQRRRIGTSKFPDPCYNSPSYDGQMTAECGQMTALNGGAVVGEGAGEDEGACESAAANADGNGRPRPRDPIWDRIQERFWPDGVPPGDRKRVGRIVRDLKAVEATPDEIDRRIEALERKWPDCTVTAESLRKNWGIAGSKKVETPGRKLALELLKKAAEKDDGTTY